MKLREWIQKVNKALTERRPIAGKGMAIEKTPKGTIYSSTATGGGEEGGGKLYPIKIAGSRGYRSDLKKHVYFGYYFPDNDGADIGEGQRCYLIPLATLTADDIAYELLYAGTGQDGKDKSSQFPFDIYNNHDGEDGSNANDYGTDEAVGDDAQLPTYSDPLTPEQINGIAVTLPRSQFWDTRFGGAETLNFYKPGLVQFIGRGQDQNGWFSVKVRAGFFDNGSSLSIIVRVSGKVYDSGMQTGQGYLDNWQYITGSINKIDGSQTCPYYSRNWYNDSWTSYTQSTWNIGVSNSATSYIDTDGDTVPDWREFFDGTDPNDVQDFKDENQDGIPDYDPNNPSEGMNPYAEDYAPPESTTIQPTDITDEFLFGFLVNPNSINYLPSRPYLTFDYPRWVKGSYCKGLHQQIIDLIPS